MEIAAIFHCRSDRRPSSEAIVAPSPRQAAASTAPWYLYTCTTQYSCTCTLVLRVVQLYLYTCTTQYSCIRVVLRRSTCTGVLRRSTCTLVLRVVHLYLYTCTAQYSCTTTASTTRLLASVPAARCLYYAAVHVLRVSWLLYK
jgi:hypothetical protein